MKKGFLFTVLFLLFFSALTSAEDISIVKIQGVLMSVDLKKSTVVINEKTFFWDQQTTFYNEAGSPITIDKLRNKGWVYIEGENDKVHKRWVAKKIYLLPKFIESKNLHLYPFIEQD